MKCGGNVNTRRKAGDGLKIDMNINQKLHAMALRDIKTWDEEAQMEWAELAAVLQFERSDVAPNRMSAELQAYQILRGKP